ncbi:MAG: diaminopimelate epimerase [Halodesulfurarchaeum sp.]
MTTVPYRKYHGTGNDFAVVDADGAAVETIEDRRRFAVRLCEKLDADGVLFLSLTEGDPVHVLFRLWQPDGSKAAMCGNGARIAARWADERTGEDTFRLETPAGPRRARVHDDSSVTVEMGTPSFDPESIPVEREEPMVEAPLEGFELTAVNTGVPHAVAMVEDVHTVELESAAPAIRHADVFPAGTNVTFASPEDEVDFAQRTYERGVEGETESCGTGAVAIAAVASRLGWVSEGETLQIRPPGGTLQVTIPGDGPATLRGPTAFEFEGALTLEAVGDSS